MMKTVIVLLGLLAVAYAGDYSYSGPCSPEGMFKANTGDLSKFIRAAGLREYLNSGACLWYGVFDTSGPTAPIVEDAINGAKILASSATQSSVTDLIGSLGTIKPSSGGGFTPNSFVPDCYIKDLSFRNFCVGYPGDVYGFTQPVGRKLLGDDYNGPSYRYFTRFATSIAVKAKIGPAFPFPNSPVSWTTVEFSINICLDIDRSGNAGLPYYADSPVAWCGDLDYTPAAPPP